MENMTIQDVLERHNLKVQDLAKQLNCCISMISKLAHNQTRITDNFRKKFNAIYPNYHLINGLSSTYEKISKLEAENIRLKAELLSTQNMLKSTKAQINKLVKAIKYFNEFVNKSTLTQGNEGGAEVFTLKDICESK